MAVEFSFLGLVLPNTPPLTIDHRPVVKSDVLATNHAKMVVAVQDGRFEVRITVASFDDGVWQGLFGPASDLARTLVEATGFVRAIPYAAFIDTLVRPNGAQQAIVLGDPSLANRHSFDETDARRIAELAKEDFPFALALSDLLMSLGKTHYSPISCGRVAESLARLIAPGVNPKAAWPMLHGALRVDEAYVKLLTDSSRASRHGDREYLPGETTQELARRAWTLMDRYLRLRLDGELDPATYPVLHG